MIFIMIAKYNLFKICEITAKKLNNLKKNSKINLKKIVNIHILALPY